MKLMMVAILAFGTAALAQRDDVIVQDVQIKSQALNKKLFEALKTEITGWQSYSVQLNNILKCDHDIEQNIYACKLLKGGWRGYEKSSTSGIFVIANAEVNGPTLFNDLNLPTVDQRMEGIGEDFATITTFKKYINSCQGEDSQFNSSFEVIRSEIEIDGKYSHEGYFVTVHLDAAKPVGNCE